MKLYRNAEAFAHILDSGTVLPDLIAGMTAGRRGQPPNANALRLALIGLGCSVISQRQATQAGAWRSLCALEIDEQVAIGFRALRDDASGPGDIVVTKPQLNRAFAALGERLDFGERQRHDLHEDERSRREQVVFTFISACLDTFDFGWNTTMFAMDATAIESWGRLRSHAQTTKVEPVERTRPTPSGRAHRKRRTRRYDQDAYWGVKTGKDGPETKHLGHFEHTLVQVPRAEADNFEVPILVRRSFVTPSEMRLVKPKSLMILRSMQSSIQDLVVDLHYSYYDVTEWADILRSMGIRQHIDLRSDEQGFIEYKRMRWVGSAPHCPGTPDDLGTITPPKLLSKDATDKERAAHSKAIKVFEGRILLREAMAMKTNRALDEDNTMQVGCPARAGRCACPLLPETMADLSGGEVVVVENPPDPNSAEGLPKVCTQKWLVVKVPAKLRKHYQPFTWGSRKWRNYYNQRTYVEGSYGYRKNPDGGGLGRGFFKIEGMARINLAVAFSALAYNLAMLRSWETKRPDQDVVPTGHPFLAAKDPDSHVVRVPTEHLDAVLAMLNT